MARDDEARLYGIIDKITKKAAADGKVRQVCLDLLVVRRPQPKPGNKRGDLKLDAVPVFVEDEGMIQYLEERQAMKGDMADVSGVPCTMRKSGDFTCWNCGAKNPCEGTADYIRPLFIRTREIHPKRAETVILTDAQRHGTREQVFKVLEDKKRFPGRIIGARDQGRTGDDQNSILIIVREEITSADVMMELDQVKEVSNLAWVEGSLCRAPEYSVTPAGGKACVYQLDISQKGPAMEDGPENRLGSIWVRSFGDQAEKDRDSLVEGSLVLITGSLQVRYSNVEKECGACRAINRVNGSTMEMEIFPYSVEYLRDCNLSGDDEDGGEFEGEGLDGWEDAGETPAIYDGGE